MTQISKLDLELAKDVMSLYHALSQSVRDPTTIDYYIIKNPKIMYYGTDYDEKDEEAINLILDRIDENDDDIIDHNTFHKDFVNLFFDLDSNMKKEDRRKISAITIELCNKVKDYLEIVEAHNKYNCAYNIPFLNYPSYNENQVYLYRESKEKNPIQLTLKFNPAIKKKSAIKKLDSIIFDADAYKNGKGEIPEINITGEKLLDFSPGSLTERFESNKNLLERLGLKLD